MVVILMAFNKFTPANFRQTAEFGTSQSALNEATGVNVPEFVTQFKVHCMPYVRTNYQTLSLLGTDYEDTIQIAIRHSQQLDHNLLCKYKGIVYKIVSISADDSSNPISYDIITLKQSKKVS